MAKFPEFYSDLRLTFCLASQGTNRRNLALVSESFEDWAESAELTDLAQTLQIEAVQLSDFFDQSHPI